MYKKNDKIAVHAYKYNGWLYRVWEFPIVMETNSEYVCIATQNSRVITSEKDSERVFVSKVFDETYWVFFKDQWFNIIVSLKKGKYYYYINIASPFLYEEGTIKYIDFDLDFIVPDINENDYKELDINEFHFNSKQYSYPAALEIAIKAARDEILNLITSKNLEEKYGVSFFEKMKELSNERKAKYGKNW